MGLLVVVALLCLVLIQLKLKTPEIKVNLQAAHIALSVASWIAVFVALPVLVYMRKWVDVVLMSPFLVLLRSSRPFVEEPPSTRGNFLLIYTLAVVLLFQIRERFH